MDTPLQIAVCDDSAEDTALLLNCVQSCCASTPTLCTTFTSGEDLLAGFTVGAFDLIFFDVYMNGMLGIEAATKIHELDDNVTLAFTTTSDEFTRESYRLGALKYLIKPVTCKEVSDTIALALAKRKTMAQLSLLIDGTHYEIPMNNILYLEQQNHAIMVHTTSGVLRTSQREKLSKIEDELPDYFLRCHQSFIVNLRQVVALDTKLRTFSMPDGGQVYIRRQDVGKAAAAYEASLFAAAREGN